MKANYLLGDGSGRKVLGASPNEMTLRTNTVKDGHVYVHATDLKNKDFTLELEFNIDDLKCMKGVLNTLICIDKKGKA
jgi:hypothetical protein